MKKDFDYYKDLIKKNKLPEGFDQWLMKNKYGETLAHIAAWNKILPPDWTDKTEDWLIKDSGDDTIAHYAAEKGILPLTWTNDEEHWKITNLHEYTVGFLYSTHHKEHYNNPKNLEDYCKNIKNHIFPFIENGTELNEYEFKIMVKFFQPFLNKINNTKQKEWMQTSDEYSGFLIEYVESIIHHIEFHNFNFEDFTHQDYLLLKEEEDNIKKVKNTIADIKMEIKESLFKKYNPIIDDNLSDFSNTL